MKNSQMEHEVIYYPKGFEPTSCPVLVRNEIFIEALSEEVWFWLTYAKSWPEWYSNSSNIEILNHGGDNLRKDTQFNWRTFNTNIKSVVRAFEPYSHLAWEARGTGLRAYHAWLIIPTTGGCKVITEETQKGWLPAIGRYFLSKGLYKQHQIWLEGLKMKAEEQ